MRTSEEILAYRCPRWENWPNLDLYMDQAVNLIGDHVAPFYADEQAKPVTSTMINNYVKQRIVPPSRKKKYGRDHLAYFYIIFLLKSALHLTDVANVVAYINRQPSPEETFNRFCDEIETALAAAFGGTPPAVPDGDNAVIRSVALTFAYTLLARFRIGQEKGESAAAAE